MMGKGWRAGLLIGVLAVVSGISLFALLQGRGRQGIEVREEGLRGRPRAEIGKNKVVVYSPTGEAMLEAEMKRGEYDKENEIARLWGVRCQLMDEGQPVSGVEAERLEFLLKENRALFGGAVRAWSEKEGVEIECEDLFWEVGEKRLHSDRPAKFQRGKMTMEGNRLEADLGLRRVGLYDGAKFLAELRLKRR